VVGKRLKEIGFKKDVKKVIYFVLENLGFDEELGKSIRDAKRVVLPLAGVKSSNVTEGDIETAKHFALILPEAVKKNLPHSEGIAVPTKVLMQGVMDIGAVNTDADIDGIIRRIPLFYRYKNTVYPSFPLAIFMHAMHITRDKIKIVPGRYVKIGGYRVPIDREQRMLINFLGRPFSFRYISFYDVLGERVGSGFFANKIVLLGSSAVALSDLKPTPASKNLMPGVELHANGLYTLMNRCFITYPNRYITLLLVFLFALIVTFLASSLKPWLSLLIAFLFFVGFLFASDIIFDTRNVWLEVIRPSYSLFLSYIIAVGYRYAVTERSKRELRHIFDRYVSREVVQEIISNPSQLKLGGERRDITVLFADIRSFTSMSESMEPEAVVSILNDYLTEMTDIILENGGTIDKFIGDAIMAVFGAPVPYKDHAFRAAKAALKVCEGLKDLWKKLEKEGKHTFDIGIGISSGEAIVGNIGSLRRTEYTAIGDTVNLGARIEPMNKEFNTHILISNDVYERIKDKVEIIDIGDVRIRGKKQQIHLFELRGLKTI